MKNISVLFLKLAVLLIIFSPNSVLAGTIDWEDVGYYYGHQEKTYREKRMKIVDDALNGVELNIGKQSQQNITIPQVKNFQINASSKNESFRQTIANKKDFKQIISDDTVEKPIIQDKPLDPNLNNLKGDKGIVIDDLFKRSNPLTKLEFGTEQYLFFYEEPDIMRDKGKMHGIFANYTYRTSDHSGIRTTKDIFTVNAYPNMFKLDTRFAWGEVDYDSNGTGTLLSVKDWTFEVRGLTGYDIPISACVFTPYAGLGYRYLNDDSGHRETSNGYWGYEREANYFYIPIGFMLSSQFKNDFSVGFDIEYDQFISGKQRSHLEDVTSSYDMVANNQNAGYGYRTSMKFVKHNESIDLYFEPFARYWHIEDSDIQPVYLNGYLYGWGIEPENITKEYGFKIGANF